MATSVVTTYWDNEITRNRAERVGQIDQDQSIYNLLQSQGMTSDQALQTLEKMLTDQSVMLATNDLMLAISVLLIFSAFVIWLVPKPTRTIDPGLSH